MTHPDKLTDPPPAQPDDKDWTWVLSQTCPECGVAAADIEPAAIPAIIADAAARWRPVLARGDARERPSIETWSPLEYGCHARDVFRVFAGRAQLILEDDVPTFANWDQDETAVAERYWAQDPAAVADELADAATRSAEVFGSVSAEQWQRRGLRSNGSEFTVETLGQYFIHDVLHHLHDVAG
jgi:hypothetical protein